MIVMNKYGIPDEIWGTLSEKARTMQVVWMLDTEELDASFAERLEDSIHAAMLYDKISRYPQA